MSLGSTDYDIRNSINKWFASFSIKDIELREYTNSQACVVSCGHCPDTNLLEAILVISLLRIHQEVQTLQNNFCE